MNTRKKVIKHIRGMGIEDIELVVELVVQDGMIQSYTATLTEESLAKMQEMLPPPTLPATGGVGAPSYAGCLALVGLGWGVVAGARSAGDQLQARPQLHPQPRPVL